MALSLARALAPVIRVNAVCPGFVETDWLRAGLGADFAKHKASWEAIAPLKSTLLPDDIAQSVLWLVEGGDKITGEVIMIDSGFHLGGAPLRAR